MIDLRVDTCDCEMMKGLREEYCCYTMLPVVSLMAFRIRRIFIDATLSASFNVPWVDAEVRGSPLNWVSRALTTIVRRAHRRLENLVRNICQGQAAKP